MPFEINQRIELGLDRPQPPAPAPIPSSVQVIAAIREALHVGSVVDVKVALDVNQDPAVLINGQLLKAMLPETAKPGDTLTVRVLANTDPLMLQILSAGQNAIPSKTKLEIKSLFQEIIQTLFPEQALEGLKTAVFKNLSAQEQSPLLKAVSSPSAQPSGESPLTEKIASLIKRLISKDVLLGEQQLATPQDTMKTMQTMVMSHSQHAVPEFKQIFTELLRLKLPAHELRLFEAVKNHLELLSKLEGELSFSTTPQTPTPALNASQLKIYTDIGGMLIAAQSPRGLEQLGNSLDKINLKAGPLILFLQSMSWLESTTDRAGATSDKIAEALLPLYAELKTLRDAKASDKDIRTALNKHIQKLGGLLPESKLSSLEAHEIESLHEELRNLESLVSAKDLINSLNTLASGSGQPQVFLMPALLSGVLSAWIIGTQPNKIAEQHQGKKHARNQNGYENVELALPFPGLGTVGVSLNFSEKDVLLAFNCENPTVASFLTGKSAQLQEQIEKMGFGQIMIKSESGEPQVDIPEWYGELIKSLTVV